MMLLAIGLALAQSEGGPDNLSQRGEDELFLCPQFSGHATALEIPRFFKKNKAIEASYDVDVDPRTHAGHRLDYPDQDLHFCALVGVQGPAGVREARVAYVRQLFVQSGVDLSALVVLTDSNEHADSLVWQSWDGPPKSAKNFVFEQNSSRKRAPTATATYAPGPDPGTSVRLRPKPGDADGDGLVDGADSCPGQAEDFDGLVDLDGCPEPGTLAHPDRGAPSAPVAQPRQTAWPSIDTPLKTGAENERDAAVVIGLEDYAFLPDVPYARADSDAFYSLVTDTLGIPPERVTLLQQGGVDQIRPALEAAGTRVGPGGRLWVYYAGHGAADPDTRVQTLLGDDTRADAASFASRALSVPDVVALASSGGGQPVVILDACFSGVGRGGSDLTGGKRFAIPAYATAAPERAIIWSATGPGEASAPLDAVEHGAFTYFAVGALRGWADEDRDGTVGVAEARDWVSRALRARQIRGQSPTWVGPADGALGAAAEAGPEL